MGCPTDDESIDLQKAIDVLMNTSFLASKDNAELVDKTIDLAISALNKQIPRRPFSGVGESLKQSVAFGYCTGCGHLVYETSAYCSECGQALKWGKEPYPVDEE